MIHASKTKAFILTVVLIMTMFLIMVVLQILDKASGFPIGEFLTAMVSIGVCYIGLQVANNGVRGKCFEPRVAEIDAANENKNTQGGER